MSLPPAAAALAAAFHVLLQMDESNEQQARAAVKAILDDMGQEEEQPQEPARHARKKGRSMLAYLRRPGVNPADALAAFYAALYSALAEAGVEVPEGEVESSDDELAPHGLGVEEGPEGWAVVRHGEDSPLRHAREPLRYAAVRAPAGGIWVNGTFYPGGRFIPAAELAKAAQVRTKRGTQSGSEFALKRRAALAVATARRRAARMDAPDPKSVLAFASRPQSPEADQAAAQDALSVIRAANGDRTPGRLLELARLAKSAPGALAHLGMVRAMATLLAREGRKLAIPKEGMLWLTPAPEEDGRQKLMAGGFLEREPARWAAEDSPESRELAQQAGYEVVKPGEGDL